MGKVSAPQTFQNYSASTQLAQNI